MSSINKLGGRKQRDGARAEVADAARDPIPGKRARSGELYSSPNSEGGIADGVAHGEPSSIDRVDTWTMTSELSSALGLNGVAGATVPAGGDAPVHRKAMSVPSWAWAGRVQARGGLGGNDVTAIAAQGVANAASSLPHQDAIQRSFGSHDVSGVRAKIGDEAADASRTIGAEAYATGDRVAFAKDPDLHTAAHEAAHVVQQRGGVQLQGGVSAAGDFYEQHADRVADLVVRGESAERLLSETSCGQGGGGTAVQRYEAGEHAQMGDTSAETKKAFAPLEYTVVSGDTLPEIAAKFKVSPEELKKANPDKVKKWPVSGGSREVEGFNAGEKLAVPQKLNEMQQDAAKDPSTKVMVNGVSLDYGTLVAMGGDLYGSVEEMSKAPAEELQELAKLIEEEKKTGRPVSTERWQKATKGRMVDLAAKNQSHFAPPNADFVAVSGESTGDHLHTWQDHHKKALNAAKAGDKNHALMINAFGDHFLTDAFAAGHLFNKADVMDKFDDQLPTKGTGEDRDFEKEPKKFFDAIAAAAFVGDVKAEFSKYETVKTYWGIHADIDSASRFSSLLQGVHLERPELLESAVAKGVHDKLNKMPGGLPVQNAFEKWNLSGDDTMNIDTLRIARQAVAQSQQNVRGAFGATAALDYPALYKKVWDFTPKPTSEGKKQVVGAINDGSDVKNPALHTAVVNLIKENYLTIITQLVKLKKLQAI